LIKILLFILLSILPFALFSKVLAQDKQTFTNPILAGFYPDPSICKVGDDYYLVNSTFAYFPGIPVFHSKDLVNWKLIGHVMDRPEQMDLTGLGVSRGIFAPAIRYNNGLFYVTCTLVDAGGNFVVVSEKPEGPYCNPVWIPEINGIDPSMFFDEDGKAYIVYNSVAPDNKPLYSGHRTIRMYEFDVENLRVTGEEKILVNGGTDLSKEPVWIEGPHIFKVNKYYYLIAAEGGTGDQHSEVVFRSDDVWGPYISYDRNPILTQRHLSSKRDFPITSTGHADFVQTQSGSWWAVFLGCRPYPLVEEGYYNTGRETFLAPIEWKNGWPIINPGFDQVQFRYPYPLQPRENFADRPYSGNFKVRYNFDEENLNADLIFLRTPFKKWYDLKKRKGYLSIQLKPETCAGKENPAFIGHRQQHLTGSTSTVVDFNPEAENEKAGLLVFQNEEHFYFLCESLNNNEQAIELYKSVANNIDDNQMELIVSQKLSEAENEKELYLKIEAAENIYSFYYALNPDDWILLKDNVDATFLSTKVAGGFVGCMYALYATSLGKSSDKIAHFDWFEYEGNDLVYQK
jgi:xylan 1,4-beta-xylosidase